MDKTIALYMRLSDEDDNLAAHEESNSISHQRKLMLDHIQKLPELKDCNIMEFSDDGYSGADFSRPNFVKMMDLVKAGKIQVIVTKDYSRLGRDYLEVGNYMECIFPVLQVRYISVNDNYDSANSFGSTGGMSVVLKNLVNRIWMDDRQEIQEKLKSQTQKYESIFKNEFVLTVLKSCEAARDDLKHINAELKMLDFKSVYSFDVNYIKDGSDYEKVLEYAKYLKEREELGTTDGQMTFESMTMYSNDRGEELEKEIKRIISKIVSSNDKEQIERFADYRNYMNYEILVSNDDVLNKAKLSKQSGYNSGAEVQIPYMLILLSALLMIYNDKTNSTRLVFIDEPFAKMDPTNVRTMLKFMKSQKLQMIFCAPDKTELIGNECQVILPVLRTKPDLMEIGIVEIHEGVSV